MSTHEYDPWSINATTTGRDLVSYQHQLEARNYWSQIKGENPKPVYQNREPHEYDPWSINATTTGRDLVSYQYQLEARNYRFQIKGADPQPVYYDR